MDIIILKFIRFSIVGCLGMGIDFGVTYLSKEKLHWHPYIANSLGFLVAVISNYILNRIWTFQSQNPLDMEFLLFCIISLIGLLINNLVLKAMYGYHKKNFYLSKLVAIGVTVLWNFSCNNFITFS